MSNQLGCHKVVNQGLLQGCQSRVATGVCVKHCLLQGCQSGDVTDTLNRHNSCIVYKVAVPLPGYSHTAASNREAEAGFIPLEAIVT